MIDEQQCPTHTRTPWGTSPHRYKPCFRHVAMGILLFCFVSVVILVIVFLIGHHTFWSNYEDHELENAAPAAGAIALVRHDRAGIHEKGSPPSCGSHRVPCGVQDNPNLCCPSAAVCKINHFSPSGVLCCPDEQTYTASLGNVPVCADRTVQCAPDVGGGCRPDPDLCPFDGCLKELHVGPSIDQRPCPSHLKGVHPVTAVVTTTHAPFYSPENRVGDHGPGLAEGKEASETYASAGSCERVPAHIHSGITPVFKCGNILATLAIAYPVLLWL